MFLNKKENKKENNLEFDIKNVNKTIINAMRRIALSNIQNVAFDDFQFDKNSTALHNEFLAHRIGLIPIKIDDIDDVQDYKFEIDVNSNTQKNLYVTTDDIQVYRNLKKVTTKSKMFIQKPDVAIITRFPNIVAKSETQELKVNFKLKAGYAYNDAKYSPTTVCVSYPNDDNDTYHFYIESVGLMDSKLIIEKSFDIMRNMLNQLNIDIDDNKLYSLNRIENFRGIEVIFNKQDTTIGYMLQDKLFKLFYIDKKELTHVSYHETHPLENMLAIRIRLNEETKEYDDFDEYSFKCLELIKIAVEDLQTDVSKVERNFKKF